MAEGLKPGWRRVKFGDVVRLNKESSKDPAVISRQAIIIKTIMTHWEERDG